MASADMAKTVTYDEVEVGTELPEQTYGIRRHSLVRYCGASGDSNVIHWNERVAKAVGLPDVIAHGSEEVTSELQAHSALVGRLLLGTET